MNNIHKKLEEIMDPVVALDWHQSAVANKVTKQALSQIREGDGIIGYLLENLYNEENLAKCEKDYNIEKYVLYQHKESGVRLRMHVMYPGTFDIPHSHRMNFTSMILYGSYMHSLYAPLDDGEVLHSADQLSLMYVKEEVPGIPYYIDHKVIHDLRVMSESRCISLMLRSPPMKRRALHFDLTTENCWWRYGSKERTEESLKNTVPLDESDVENLVTLLHANKII